MISKEYGETERLLKLIHLELRRIPHILSMKYQNEYADVNFI